MNPEPAAVITIIMQADGKVNVNGPIANKVLSLGLLAIARRLVEDYVPNEKPPIVVIPANGMPQ